MSQRIDPIGRRPVPAAVDPMVHIQPVDRRDPRPDDEQEHPRREPPRPTPPDDGLPHVDVVA